MWGAKGLTLLLPPASEGSRAEENTPSSAHLPLQSPPPWALVPAHQALPVLSPFLYKRVSHHHHQTVQHFPIATACVTGSDAGLLTPEHASPPQPHCARRGCR